MGAVSCTACEAAKDKSAVKVAPSKSCLKKPSSDEAEDGLARFRDTLKKSFKNPKDAFKVLDRDGDASLDKGEFAEAVVNAGKKAKWDKDTTAFMTGLSEEIFGMMDEDGDGNLTFEEFKAALQRTLLIDMKSKGKKKGSEPASPTSPTSPTSGTASPTSPSSSKEGKKARRSSSTVSTMAATMGSLEEMPASEPGSPGLEDPASPGSPGKDMKRALRRRSSAADLEDPSSPTETEPGSPASPTDAKKRLSRRSSGIVDDADDPIVFLRGLLKKSFKDPKDAFKALDQDGDKALDIDEFAKMLVKVAKDNKWEKKSVAVLDSVAKDIFKSMDSNGDGSVTMQEFKERLAAKA